MREVSFDPRVTSTHGAKLLENQQTAGGSESTHPGCAMTQVPRKFGVDTKSRAKLCVLTSKRRKNLRAITGGCFERSPKRAPETRAERLLECLAIDVVFSQQLSHGAPFLADQSRSRGNISPAVGKRSMNKLALELCDE